MHNSLIDTTFILHGGQQRMKRNASAHIRARQWITTEQIFHLFALWHPFDFLTFYLVVGTTIDAFDSQCCSMLQLKIH